VFKCRSNNRLLETRFDDLTDTHLRSPIPTAFKWAGVRLLLVKSSGDDLLSLWGKCLCAFEAPLCCGIASRHCIFFLTVLRRANATDLAQRHLDLHNRLCHLLLARNLPGRYDRLAVSPLSLVKTEDHGRLHARSMQRQKFLQKWKCRDAPGRQKNSGMVSRRGLFTGSIGGLCRATFEGRSDFSKDMSKVRPRLPK
jgi:hypothetical protein